MLSAPDVVGLLEGHPPTAAARWSSSTRDAPTPPRRPREWVPIRPGTDAAAAVRDAARPSTTKGSVRGTRTWRGRVTGLDDVIALAEPFTPERGGTPPAYSAETIRRLARELAEADNPVLYCRIGACTQEFGTLADLARVRRQRRARGRRPAGRHAVRQARRRGRRCSSKPPDQTGAGLGVRSVPQPGERRTRGARSVSRRAAWPRRSTRRATGRIRALITVAGNPVVSSPGAGALDARHCRSSTR